MSRRHSVVSVVAAVLVGFSVWGVLAWRARQATVTVNQLCVVIARIIDGTDRSLGLPGTSTADYFAEHPKALAAAHRESRSNLAQLPCQPPKEAP